MKPVFALLFLLVATPLFASEPEGSIRAANVTPGAEILTWTCDVPATLSGFGLRLTNPLPPRDEPIVAALLVDGKRLPQTVAIPRFEYPLAKHTRPVKFDPPTFPTPDVGREYRVAIEPLELREGAVVQVVVDSSGRDVRGGVTACLQFQGEHELASMRAPFREARTNGPVCSIPWSETEIVAVGTQAKFDPLCAPQNNSSVIADNDGTLYIFCAYYSVDEQYGGGRGGSYSRIFGYKKSPNDKSWEPLGLIVDLMEGGTYSGDPFVFRDLDGTPCLLFTSCDGTNGFADWKTLCTYIQRSQTDSFMGPWSDPVALWKDYPREPDDNKNGGRANCVRIYPREKTQDYLVVWNHGAQDMDIRGLVVDSLDKEISHEAIGSAPVFVNDQEEGGGGCVYNNKGYYSTWQIPWLNDPNGQQRLYEIDLDSPLDPASWRVVPGSIGFNAGADTMRDGGTTADAWAISVANVRVYATSCEFSVTKRKNCLCVRSAPLQAFDDYLEGKRPTDCVFRYGAVRVQGYHEVFPTIEYAIGKQAAFEMDFRSEGELSYGFIALGADDAQEMRRSIYFEFNPTGVMFVAYKDSPERLVLAEASQPTWRPGVTYRVKLVRDDARLVGYVDGAKVLEITIDDPEILAALDASPRFRLYGWQGGNYEISNAVLTDGAL